MQKTANITDVKDFLVEVDAILERTCGLSSADLPDFDISGAYYDGYTPAECAMEILEEAGFPIDLLEGDF